jgi:hypothetical protein
MVLGILGIVMGGVGLILGPIAWIMGRNDLREMDAGRMDDAGRGSTNAGRICGIIATAVHGMGALCCLGYFLFMGAMFTSFIGAAAKTQTQVQKAQADAEKASREARARQKQLEANANKAWKAAVEKAVAETQEIDADVPKSPPKRPNPVAIPRRRRRHPRPRKRPRKPPQVRRRLPRPRPIPLRPRRPTHPSPGARLPSTSFA